MYDAQVVYCSGLERIEDAGGGNFRFCLFEQRGPTREIVLEVICPAGAVPDAIMQAICALTAAGVAAVKVPFMELLMQ